MHLMIILIAAGCLLLFFAGVCTGYAILCRRLSTLSARHDELADESVLHKKTLDDSKTKYTRLSEEYRHLYESYNLLRNSHASLQQQLGHMEESEITSKNAMSTYEKAAFEYNAKIEQLVSAQKENNVLGMQVAVQKKRIAELEELRGYVERYNNVLAHARNLRVINAQLKEENTHLRSVGINLGHFGSVNKVKTITSESSLADVCTRILEKTESYGTTRGAVIADEMGFAIVASSEFADELAGISVLHDYCDKIVNSNIAFGKVTRITLKNANNLCLTILPFKVNDQIVYYSGLSHGQTEPLPSETRITHAVVIN